MRKINFILLIMPTIFFTQVGINTTTPKATLDIVGKPTSTIAVDGVIVPRLTGDQLKSKDAVYTSADQTGSIVYVTQPVGTASTKTTYVTAAGYFFFDGTYWQKINVSAYNGLTKDGTGIALGGALVKPTLISALTSTNTMTFQSPNTADAYLTVQATGSSGQSGGIFLGNKNHGITRGFPAIGEDNNIGLFTTNANLFLSTHGKQTGEFILKNSNSFVGLGTVDPDARLTLVGDGSGSDDITLRSISNDVGRGSIYLCRSRGTTTAKTIVQNGDILGDLIFKGYDGSAYIEGAHILAISNGTMASGSIPTDLVFKTGGTLPIGSEEKLRISSTGNVGIGTSTPLEKLQVSGAVKISSAYTSSTITAGATTPSPSGGSGTIVFQNSHFFAWTGSQWKQLDN